MPTTPQDRPVAAILAGGRGTRLATVLPDRPKALAPVLGRPILAHLLDRLEAGGLDRAVVCSGWRGDEIEREMGARHGIIRLDYSLEPAPLGTGGALRHAVPLLDSPTVVVCNGDSLVAVDVEEVLRRHRSAGRPLTLVVSPVADAARFGTVAVNDGIATGFRAAGLAGGSGPALVSAGILVVARRLLEEIDPCMPRSLEADVLPGWLARGATAFVAERGFLDIGTPGSWAAAGAWLQAHPVPARATHPSDGAPRGEERAA